MRPAPLGYAPYDPPGSASGERPRVITLFRIYAALTVLIFLGFGAIWVWISLSASGGGAPKAASFAMAAVFVLVLGGFYGVAAAVPYKPWGWAVGLVAISLGLTGCLAPFAIYLLVNWVRPETKAAFGRL